MRKRRRAAKKRPQKEGPGTGGVVTAQGVQSEPKSIAELARELGQECRAGAVIAKRQIFGTGNFKKKVVSEALAVHPRQIPEAIATAKKLGVAVPDFDSHGRPTFDNSAHFRRYAKVHGFRHLGYA